MRETSMGCLLHMPPPGTEPATFGPKIQRSHPRSHWARGERSVFLVKFQGFHTLLPQNLST